MKRIMVHEIGINADSVKYALHMRDQLSSFPLVAEGLNVNQ